MPRAEALFDIASLDDLNMDALRALWRAHLGGDPPPLRAPELLRRELAQRLQAKIYGDIDPALRQRLDRLARQQAGQASPKPSAPRLAVGSTLTREWDGVRYAVVVLQDGYLFEGKTYRSLSQIACAITGVHWSGPRFFGLTEQPK